MVGGQELVIILILGGMLGVAVVILLGFVEIYNGLVAARNRCESAWSQIDVQLRRRYDLIPNLVETVKGYAAHEKETLDAVISARNAGMQATTVEDQAQAENMITQALGRLFALSESYPDLKASQNFLQLQAELGNTEGAIAQAREYYTECVRNYNNRTEMFPHSFAAGLFNFKPKEYFEIEEPEAREPVKVDFSG